MTPVDVPEASAPAHSAPPRRGALALALQETLTATVRLRANRQSAADAEAFRAHVKQLLATADADARRIGYAPEDVNLAMFAVVAFLDESVLNSGQAMFADWPRRPLQEELFGGHMAGELFFQYLDQLLRRPDGDDTADVLEVYAQCLLLGFRGRYSAADPAELHRLTTLASQKISRVRGGAGRLSPHWAPLVNETVPRARDPWLRPLVTITAALATVALMLWAGYRLSIGRDVNRVVAAEARSA